MKRALSRLPAAFAVAAILAATPVGTAAAFGEPAVPKHLAPIPGATLSAMAARDTAPSAPILLRSFKKEAELEVWKQNRAGRYVLLKTFPICRWSGQLGPKTRVGDRQAPEGYYAVAARQMNPNSAYHLSFDLGYPNVFDRAHGRTGSALMVHGTCSSAGCFAMTDAAVSEIYALAREAFAGGQTAFQFQAYPFRMTAQNMARHRSDPHLNFWRQLKDGSDRFEATGREPLVKVAAGRYRFEPFRDAAVEALAAQRRSDEDARVATLIAEGSASVRTTYADGGQHPSFRLLARQGAVLGEISRPEALAFAGREIVLIPARAKTQLAAVLPPVRDGGGTGAAAAAASATDLSVFALAPLGYGPLWPAPSGAVLGGSVRILPSTLQSTTYRLAAR